MSFFYAVRVDSLTWIVLRQNAEAADKNYASQPNTWRVDSYWGSAEEAYDRCLFLRGVV